MFFHFIPRLYRYRSMQNEDVQNETVESFTPAAKTKAVRVVTSGPILYGQRRLLPKNARLTGEQN
jgi:hypothetical protein